ncbi:MAG TPA: PHP domain-containing protein [Vicinamibacterales bacterium]|nr:PHP domain-containing protein [Vicinamibacterales bacterium]
MDVNAQVAGFLRDLSFAQTSQQKMWGYKRASSSIMRLEQQLTELRDVSGALPKISGIGPASARVIREVLDAGVSATVENAIDESGKRAEVDRRRALRRHFLSRAEVLRVLADQSLTGPRLEDYRGDFQMHSEWSDGVTTLSEIVEACQSRGYTCAAVTDHSHGLKIAGGMTMEEAADQRRAIDTLNARSDGFRLLQGIEANIAADGRLDLSDEESSQFEIVLAAPHSSLRKAHDQTDRMLTAVRNPRVRILAHPRGRMSGSRAGVIARWPEVFAEAASLGVAIEIDGDPSRQDLDHTLATEARQAGCLFALDSDAHSTAQLAYAETAIAHARLAGIPTDRVVNCWPFERLSAWLDDRRSR